MSMAPADGKELYAELWLQLARACDKGFTLTPASSCQSILTAMCEAARSSGCFYGAASTTVLQHPNLVPWTKEEVNKANEKLCQGCIATSW